MAESVTGAWKWLVLYLVCCKQASSLQVTLTSGRVILGNSVAINCSATFEATETERRLEVQARRRGMVFSWAQVEERTSSPPKTGERYKVSIDTSTDNMIVMSLEVEELVCNDGGVYVCTAVAGDRNSSRSVETRHQLQLKVEVPPSPPSALRVEPQTAMVREDEWFDILCSAVVGQEGEHSLQWRIYVDQTVETVHKRDARVILEEASNLTGADWCKQLVTSKLRLTVTRKDQNCQAACFLWNSRLDQPPPTYCSHSKRDLCALTSRLEVHYGVSEEATQLNIFPEVAVTEGATLNIVCYADGYPPANYTWYRSQPQWLRNKAVPSRRVGNASWLSIASFSSEVDAGTYRCTAWNWVMGVELFSASVEISISTSDLGKKQHLTLTNAAFLKNADNTTMILIGIFLSVSLAVVLSAIYLCLLCTVRRCRYSCKSERQRSIRYGKPDKGTVKEDSGSSADTSVTETESDA